MDDLFWHRDLGLLTKAFRELGHDAWLVVHPAKLRPRGSKVWSEAGPPPSTRHDPVIWASPSEVRTPAWWQGHKPDLVILGLWTRPKYDPIRRAALSATPRVIERADSDGMRTASCGLQAYARRRYDYFRDRTFRWPAFLSVPASALYSFASILATPWIEGRLTRTLKILPSITIETPAATNLWRKLATKIGAAPHLIHCIPHPVQTDIFKLDPTISKKNQIISVGRWESHQKNLPLLLKTLACFLDQNPSWNALVVGSGLPNTCWHPRIAFLWTLSAPSLAQKMQESKIFLSSSRYESFGLAGTEAAACGCVAVGPRTILSHIENPSYPAPSSNLLNRVSWAAKALAKARQPFPLEMFSGRYVAKAFLALLIDNPKSSADSRGYGCCPTCESPSTPDTTTAKGH